MRLFTAASVAESERGLTRLCHAARHLILPPTHLVEAAIGRHPKEKRLELRARPVPLRAPVEPKENLLRQLLRPRPIADEAVREPGHAGLVAIEENGECLLLAGCYPQHELGIHVGFHECSNPLQSVKLRCAGPWRIEARRNG